jgi:hypothetical protein
MVFESFAQRLLNPFRGVMHTLRHESAEAVTVDGIHWDIYVANTAPTPTQGRERLGQLSEIRYGKWSQATGLKRGRMYPSEDFRRMEALGTILFEHLTRVHRQVPFAYRDRFELWLLDSETRPLALLDSALEESALNADPAIDWRAGFAARERFQSRAIASLHAGPGQAPNAGDYLARYVNARAGQPAAAQWFRRESAGHGTGLRGIHLPDGLEGRSLAASAFPPLYLDGAGHDEPHRQLIEDFHAWQAPWLLLLPQPDTATRRWLEQQARRQAVRVDQQYRLYPDSVDESMITAARVEATMRRSQEPSAREKDETLPPFYIELGPEEEESP